MITGITKKIRKGSDLISDVVRTTVSIHILAPLYGLKHLQRSFPTEALGVEVNNSENLMQRTFTILGRTVSFDKEIDWEADFVGGSWPLLLAPRYSRYFENDYSEEEYKAHGDVKRAWDFNKHIHFVDLAKIYSRTGKREYDVEICSQFKDWVAKHPYPLGIGWNQPLIVAQRSISWILAYNLGCLSSVEGDAARSLFIHGIDLRRRLELSPSGWNTNHLIGELAALFLIGKTIGMRSWEKQALELLAKELNKQVLPDGVHYEQSSGYHRYVVEFLTLVWLASKEPWLNEAISKMTEFLRAIAFPDDALPLLSDQDGARVWACDPCRPIELFNLVHTKSPASEAFSDSGYYVMRYADHVLIFDCGPIGMKGVQLRTHGHSDLLSFVFCTFGKPFIVDIGSGTYTENKALHDYFRSTAGHNTVTMDEKDQCGLSGTWGLDKHPAYRLVEWSTSDHEDSVCGLHEGYHPVIHRRRVSLCKQENPVVRILDEIIGTGMHKITARMHLHPDVQVQKLSGASMKLRNGNATLDVDVQDCPRAFSLSVKDGFFSPDYGRILQTSVVELTTHTECPVKILTVLTSHRAEK